MMTSTLFSNLSFEVGAGEIVLICGPSGAGKTTLLSILNRRLDDPTAPLQGLKGTVRVRRGDEVASLGAISLARPLVDSLGPGPLEHSLFALNVSGLAEPHLYVKRFHELSNGQRYRAMVARLIASNADVWVADEYCATLDPVTANIVSRNLHRCAKTLGVTVILAAANWSEFIHELRPDTVVHLRSPWDYRVFSWKQFSAAIARSSAMRSGVTVGGQTLRRGRR